MKRKAIVAFVMAVLTASGPVPAADVLPDLGELSRETLSPVAERRLGEEVMRDIRWRDPAYIDDPELEAYVNEIGHRLVAFSQDAQQSFQFFVIRDPTLNAFALPGGFVGLHSGLILAARSESELAGVLAHEIAHVTQHHIARLIGGQSQASLVTIAAMLLAVLAARSNPQAGQAAVAAGAAFSIQSQINYTRDFEREADRIGFQTLERSGYDVSGMATFFERLQKVGRLYENNAPAYLHTHPLTVERIADMENRSRARRYKQVPDSLGFLMVRAKLRAQLGTPAEAVADFAEQLRRKSFPNEGVMRYGYALALFRARDYAAAEAEIEKLRALKLSSPMVETLSAELRLARSDTEGALLGYRKSRERFPHDQALLYGLAATLIGANRSREALELVSGQLELRPSDARLWSLQGKAYAALGKRLQQHRSQAEVYVLQGTLAAAIEQLEIGRRAADADFYVSSELDARLRDLKARQREEEKETKR